MREMDASDDTPSQALAYHKELRSETPFCILNLVTKIPMRTILSVHTGRRFPTAVSKRWPMVQKRFRTTGQVVKDPRGPPGNCGPHTHGVTCRSNKDQFYKCLSAVYVLTIREI